jgi:CheY-like chemotaxis protein
MLKVLLRCEGHEARIAFDGPSAIEAATLTLPDVVFLDLTLPGMSGVEVAAKLRCLPELSTCRLVAVTGYGEERLPSPSPFDHHFQKPVDLAALLGYLAGIEAARTPTLLAAAVA